MDCCQQAFALIDAISLGGLGEPDGYAPLIGCTASRLLFALVFLSEYLCGEGFDGRAILPGVERESGFAAGLLEESDAIPMALDGNLRQKQAAASSHADEQAMASDLDRFGVDGARRRKNAEFDFEIAGFVEVYGMEASVFKGGGTRGFGDGAIHRVGGEDIADASAELAAKIERGKCAAWFG